MKKLVSFLITVFLLLCLTSTAYAKQQSEGETDNKQNNSIERTRQDFKLNGTPVIKYGRYKLPTAPITKGMGAKVTFDKKTAVLIVSKGSVRIIINFKNEIVSVNNTDYSESEIFSAEDDKKTNVLIRYIAQMLGGDVNFGDDEVTVEMPTLDLPAKIILTPFGADVVPNALNCTTQYMNAAAEITAGQAAGGKAELYVGSKLVSTDTQITELDTSVTFTTSDGTPTNEELKAIIPEGGVVTVRLYNKSSKYVTSVAANPVLIADYEAPTISSINSVAYNKAEGLLKIRVSGAKAVGDKFDVTKLILYDYNTMKSYRLSDTPGTGSTGTVQSDGIIMVNLGSADREGLKGFEGSKLSIKVLSGVLLEDFAGNIFTGLYSDQIINVFEFGGLDAPTQITINTVGTTKVANAINLTTQCMTITAKIKPGQSDGGKAELYIGSMLIATDNFISPLDDTVEFTTPDGKPSNVVLQKVVPNGGVVSIKLYNVLGESVISTENPVLTADYISPTISAVYSAAFNSVKSQLILKVSGAGAVGDWVDVTKLFIFDSASGNIYQLTDKNQLTASHGVVSSDTTLVIVLGPDDKQALSDFNINTMSLTISVGELLKDSAGNTSPGFTVSKVIPVYDKEMK